MRARTPQESIGWLALVNMEMSSRSIRQTFNRLRHYQLVNEDSNPWPLSRSYGACEDVKGLPLSLIRTPRTLQRAIT
jgi:hypothetical protein